MDIRFLIVGAPFLIAFFYTLFWLKNGVLLILRIIICQKIFLLKMNQ